MQVITLSGNSATAAPPPLPTHTPLDMESGDHSMSELLAVQREVVTAQEMEISLADGVQTGFDVAQVFHLGAGALKSGTQLAQGNFAGAGITLAKEGLKYGVGEMAEDLIVGHLRDREVALAQEMGEEMDQEITAKHTQMLMQ